MNNTQLYLAIGLPTLASLCTLSTVIIGIFLSRADYNRLSDKLDKLGDALRAEMISFRREMHQDMILLHERIVKVETKQGL
jgi:hypothetical protein